MSSAMDRASGRVPPEVHARFGEAWRQMSTNTVLAHSRIAEQLGLSGTDHKCLELVIRAGEALTAGRIAQLSGLSTGAVTGVIDRLERRGYVRRVRDPHDRRKVLVEVCDLDHEAIDARFRDLAELGERTLSQFTPQEWETILRYFELSNEHFAQAEQARRAGE